MFHLKTVYFILFLAIVSCIKRPSNNHLLVGSWITNTAYDSVLSIHTFDPNGNYFIDDSSKGKRYRKFTNSYKISKDGKELVVTLASGDQPTFVISKLKQNKLHLSLGKYEKKYTRYASLFQKKITKQAG